MWFRLIFDDNFQVLSFVLARDGKFYWRATDIALLMGYVSVHKWARRRNIQRCVKDVLPLWYPYPNMILYTYEEMCTAIQYSSKGELGRIIPRIIRVFQLGRIAHNIQQSIYPDRPIRGIELKIQEGELFNLFIQRMIQREYVEKNRILVKNSGTNPTSGQMCNTNSDCETSDCSQHSISMQCKRHTQQEVYVNGEKVINASELQVSLIVKREYVVKGMKVKLSREIHRNWLNDLNVEKNKFFVRDKKSVLEAKMNRYYFRKHFKKSEVEVKHSDFGESTNGPKLVVPQNIIGVDTHRCVSNYFTNHADNVCNP